MHVALVAQWIERLTTDQKVGGSTPSERTKKVQVGGYFRPTRALTGGSSGPVLTNPDDGLRARLRVFRGADSVGVASTHERYEVEKDSIAPLVVDARACAELIGISWSWMQKLCAAEAWRRDELPPPTFVGRGSGKRDRWGRTGGKRVWELAAVTEWLEQHRWRPVE